MAASVSQQTINNPWIDGDRPISAQDDKPVTTSKKKPSKEPKIISDLKESGNLFHDKDKEAFCFFGGECISLKSKKMEQWLSKTFYESEGKGLSSDSLNKELTQLAGRAVFDGPEIELCNRVAKKDEMFWYDLGNAKAVKTSPSGWAIVDSPILFRRYSHQQSQVVPVSGGNPENVFKFLNVSKVNQLLVLVYIVSCFIPDIPHPILHPHGPQGSAKTSGCTIIKKIVDPSSLEAIITPKNASELIQMIAHHHVCFFDNMSELKPWMSDILAQVSTGGSFSKRELFTDDDDIIYKLKRCVGINGINLLISRPDLMDRSILLLLDRIEPTHRIEEAVLWQEFEKDRPQILGGIFDTLSKAMAIYPNVKLDRLNRMADFTKWGFAIAEALGGRGSEFLRKYQENIDIQNEQVVQGNTLAQVVLSFMANRQDYTGLIGDLYIDLKRIANPAWNDDTFPREARLLRNHLERIRHTLKECKIEFAIAEKRTSHGVLISVKKV